MRGLARGDRVVVPFNISCGTCFMCSQGLQSQCETTQVHAYGSGAALFGCTRLLAAHAAGEPSFVWGLLYGQEQAEADRRERELPTVWADASRRDPRKRLDQAR